MHVENVKKMLWMAMLLFSLVACTKNKVKCTGDSEKNFAVTNFSKIKIGDNFKVYITKGAAFSVKAKGCTESINDLDLAVGNGNLLTVKYRTGNVVHEAIDLYITMPELLAYEADAAAKATINGMAGQPLYMRVVLSGASECVINGAAIEMFFDLSGASKLEISGTTTNLTGELSGASHLKSYGLTATRVDISASGASEAYVIVHDKLYAEASGASTIRYKGNPPVAQINTNGSAKVIKE